MIILKKQCERKKVWETNSSSAHSLTISNTDNEFDIKNAINNGCLTLYLGKYGWGEGTDEDFLDTPETKLAYLFTLAGAGRYSNKHEDILITSSNRYNFTEVHLKELIVYVFDVLECDELLLTNAYETYIDHQSDRWEYMVDNNISIEELVSNNNYVICIDHDNY